LLVKHLYTPALVTSLAALWSAAPGRVPIQRGVDPHVTYHVRPRHWRRARPPLQRTIVV